MRLFFYVFCLLILFSNCTNKSNSNVKLSHFIPENSAIILRTNSLDSLVSDVKNNEFISELSYTKLLENLTKELKKLDSLKITNEAIICISENNQYSFITGLTEDIRINDTLQASTKELFKTIIDSVMVVSTSKDIIDAVTTKKEDNSYFEKLLNSTSNSNSTSKSPRRPPKRGQYPTFLLISKEEGRLL